jgi:hypothetical protein
MADRAAEWPQYEELVRYSRLVEKLLRDAPELGEHTVVEGVATKAASRWATLRTFAYGAEYKITIERQ